MPAHVTRIDSDYLMTAQAQWKAFSSEDADTNPSDVIENRSQLASMLDATLLKADATTQAFTRLCEESTQFGVFGVCVPPNRLTLCKRLLPETIKTITVIGFPFGYSGKEIKRVQAELALSEGADELDVVIDIAAIKEGAFVKAREELEALVRISDKPLKIILETCLLTGTEIAASAQVCVDAGAGWVKTSTGMGAGADVKTIKLLSSVLPNDINIKASGGIKTINDVQALYGAGARRFGTSRPFDILKDMPS